MLTDQQRAKLRLVARSPYHPDLGKENARLLAVLTDLQKENPSAFLRDDDLPQRRFFHKPEGVLPFLTFEKLKL